MEQNVMSFTSSNKSKWDLNEELHLLNAISNCGLGNWEEVARRVPPFTPAECELHYLEKFAQDFENLRTPPLCSKNCKMKLEENSIYSHNNFEIWNLNKMLKKIKRDEEKNFDEYLNVQFPQQNTSTCSSPCTEYNNMRSDFVIEYNNNAESILRLIGCNQGEESKMNEDSFLMSEMEFALMQSYNSCLVEREFRKRLIRNHALIDRRKTYTMLQRLEVPFGKQTLKALIPLMRFLTGPQFDFLVERLKYQIEIKLKLLSYIEYRKNGLIYLEAIEIYKKLKNKRQKYNMELQYESMFLNFDDKSSIKKPTQPLALEHLPGYNLINQEEKELCSNARIVPETYNTFKELLIAECKKHNGLKLAQARTLIKIDVNKTRKIYNYLLSVNLIWQPSS